MFIVVCFDFLYIKPSENELKPQPCLLLGLTRSLDRRGSGRGSSHRLFHQGQHQQLVQKDQQIPPQPSRLGLPHRLDHSVRTHLCGWLDGPVRRHHILPHNYQGPLWNSAGPQLVVVPYFLHQEMDRFSSWDHHCYGCNDCNYYGSEFCKRSRHSGIFVDPLHSLDFFCYSPQLLRLEIQRRRIAQFGEKGRS